MCLPAGPALTHVNNFSARRVARPTDPLVNRPDKVADFVALGLHFHADLAPACGNSLLNDIVAQLVNVEQHQLWALVNQLELPAPPVPRRVRAGPTG